MYVLRLGRDSDLKIILQLHTVGMLEIKSWGLQPQPRLDAQRSQKHHGVLMRTCASEQCQLTLILHSTYHRTTHGFPQT